MLSGLVFLGCFLYGSADVIAGRLDSAAQLAADAAFYRLGGAGPAGDAAASERSETEEALRIERKPLSALALREESYAPLPQLPEESEPSEGGAAESEPLPQLPEIPQQEHGPDDFSEMTLSGGSEVCGLSIKSDPQAETVDFEALLDRTPAIGPYGDGAPCVLIYHTHTCESYATDEDDAARSEDQSRGVAAVGEVAAQVLRSYGIGVIHDTSVYDTTYAGSYARSEAGAREILAQHPSITVTIDLHRDSLRTASGERIRPTASVRGRKAAQIMVLAGCDPDGELGFPDWRENLVFALRLQQNLQSLGEDLPRPLYYCNRVYNMNLTKASLLVEVGTDGNYLDEALRSGELLGEALAQVILSAAQ